MRRYQSLRSPQDGYIPILKKCQITFLKSNISGGYLVARTLYPSLHTSSQILILENQILISASSSSKKIRLCVGEAEAMMDLLRLMLRLRAS